jgi:adenosylhomocysteine nucleosidase
MAEERTLLEDLLGSSTRILTTGIGKVNAAMFAALAIHQHKPDLILNVGCAGGLDPNLRVGDVVVGHMALQHDYGRRGDDGFTRYRPGTLPVGPVTNPYLFCGSSLTQELINKVGALPAMFFRAVPGTVATGDCFLASSHFCTELHERTMARVVDMEAAAIASAALASRVPALFVKGISDTGSESAGTDFGDNLRKAMHHAAEIAAMLEVWARDGKVL